VGNAAYVTNASAYTPATSRSRVDERLLYIRSLCPAVNIIMFESRGVEPSKSSFCVLDGSGDLDVEGIVSVVARLAPATSLSAVSLNEGLLAERLLRFWRSKRERLYMDRVSFYQYLALSGTCACVCVYMRARLFCCFPTLNSVDDCVSEDPNCVPASALVAQFDDCAAKLSRFSLALGSADGRFSAFRLVPSLTASQPNPSH
jgi:hypothetical protein